MSGQKTNLTRLKNPKDSALLIEQWASFDDVKYMNATHGRNQSILDYLTSQISGTGLIYTASVYVTNLKIGQKASAIDIFRSSNLDRIDSDASPKLLTAYPVSMLKEGSTAYWYPGWEIDAGSIKNSQFTGTNFDFLLAMYAQIIGNTFTKCSFRFANLVHAHLKNNTFIDCDFSYTWFNIEGIQDVLRFWIANDFLNCNLSNINAPELVAVGVNFIGCDMNNSTFKITDNWRTGNIQDSVIKDCEMKGSTFFLGNGVSHLKIDGTTATNSTFENSSSASKGIIRAENSNFSKSSFKHSKIIAECTNNSFINTQFISSFEITSDADISGSDFTGSNLATWYATKADLKATGCTYDERTIWVDGTPL